jgi:hypothetical protein
MVRHYFTLPCLNLLFIFSNGFWYLIKFKFNIL